MPKLKPTGFELSVSARDDGSLEAAYISLSDAKIAKTKAIIEDILLADYSSKGKLIGIEILAPVKISDLIGLVDKPRRDPFSKFVRRAAPQNLVVL